MWYFRLVLVDTSGLSEAEEEEISLLFLRGSGIPSHQVGGG